MEIQHHPFIVSFSSEHQAHLVQAARTSYFKPQTIIFEEGDPSDTVCLILEGTVNFFKKLPDGREQMISTVQAGSFFGEIGVLTDAPRSLKAVAQTDLCLAFLDKAEVLKAIHLGQNNPMGQILKGLVQHLHLTTTQYVQEVIQQEKLSLVGTMINSLLHDFKNPFSVITMSAQLLAGEHSDDLTQDLCKTIEDQINYMLKMASEISEYSQGKKQLSVSAVNLKNLMERFVELNPLLCKDPEVKIDIAVPSIELEAEDIKLLRVMQNLISNGVEACKQKLKKESTALQKPEATVSIAAREDPESVEITVRDTGSGIPDAIKGSFFKPFVSYGKANGTGLGAAIVKSIVENHGGSIRFETGPGGTCFKIILPKKQKNH